MLRITIDLIPYGDEKKKETLGTIKVINMGKSMFGNYSYLAGVEVKGIKPFDFRFEHERKKNVLILLWRLFSAIKHDNLPDWTENAG